MYLVLLFQEVKMGLEEVKKEIIENAEKKAEGIVKEGKDEADRIIKETDAQLEDYRKRSEDDAHKIISAMERKERSSAEFDVKKMKLDKKKEIIDRAFSEVKKKLQSMPDKKRESYLKNLLDDAKKEIDVAKVYVNSQDRKIAERITGKGISVDGSEISGGLVAENSDSTISVDYSYDELLDTVEKENLQEIASKLFGKD
ncbi:hypothetical protein GF345_06790 [Candidatus Woesearchaeota archaeon]|nr:hypothetical protein [Candidatus Woesearchaeota archaeon]